MDFSYLFQLSYWLSIPLCVRTQLSVYFGRTTCWYCWYYSKRTLFSVNAVAFAAWSWTLHYFIVDDYLIRHLFWTVYLRGLWFICYVHLRKKLVERSLRCIFYRCQWFQQGGFGSVGLQVSFFPWDQVHELMVWLDYWLAI